MDATDQFELLVHACLSDPNALAQVGSSSLADAVVHRLVTDGALTKGEILALILNSRFPTKLMRELITYYTQDGEVSLGLLDALGEIPIGAIKEHGLQSLVFPLFGFDPASEVLPGPVTCASAHECHPTN